MERDLVKQKGRRASRKNAVDPIDQGTVRAPVSIQGVRPVLGSALGVYVGEDVRPSKAVDGLLGVSDHEERTRRSPPDPIKNFILGRIRVLKFVDQRHGIALEDIGLERFPPFPFQGGDEIREQTIKGPSPPLGLATHPLPSHESHQLDAPIQPLGREQLRVGHVRFGKALQALKDRVLGRRRLLGCLALYFLASELHELRVESLAVLVEGRPTGDRARQNIVHLPGPDRFDCRLRRVARVIENPLTGAFGNQLHRTRARCLPIPSRRLESLVPGLGRRLDFSAEGRRRIRDNLYSRRREHRRCQLGQRPGRGRGLNAQPANEIPRRIEEGPSPIVLHHFSHKQGIVRDQFGPKGHATLKSIFFEDAVAKTVDGGNCRLVETPQSLNQPISIPGGFAAFNATGNKLIKHRVGSPARRVLGDQPGFENLAGFPEPLPNALAQFGCGRLGKSHHQNLIHLEIALEKQPQVEGRNRERLSGARTGFDQLGAIEFNRKGLQGLHPLISSR